MSTGNLITRIAVFLGVCSTFSPFYSQSIDLTENIMPALAQHRFESQLKNEVMLAYGSDDTSLQSRSFRKGDWNYKQNWRYDKEAYFRGESQAQARRNNNSQGSKNIGYDSEPTKKNEQQSHESKGAGFHDANGSSFNDYHPPSYNGYE